MDHLCYFCLVLFCFHARLFVYVLWAPAGKGLISWLSFVTSNCDVVISRWYPESGVVLDCIYSCSLPSFLLLISLLMAKLGRSWPPCLLCSYMCSKDGSGGCQVWEYPCVLEGQLGAE